MIAWAGEAQSRLPLCGRNRFGGLANGSGFRCRSCQHTGLVLECVVNRAATAATRTSARIDRGGTAGVAGPLAHAIAGLTAGGRSAVEVSPPHLAASVAAVAAVKNLEQPGQRAAWGSAGAWARRTGATGDVALTARLWRGARSACGGFAGRTSRLSTATAAPAASATRVSRAQGSRAKGPADPPAGRASHVRDE